MIAALLSQGESQLRAAGRDSARLEAELLLARALTQSRSHLLAWPERPVPPNATDQYRRLIQRACAGEPLAYLLGEREFWSLPLEVTPAVLVPRPETELLVERCLALASPLAASTSASPAAAAPCRVCDLGTGSGAIALALASERPDWQIIATDRSSAALAVACANALRLGLTQVQFLQGEWFEPLQARCFDLLVSNPPYVAAADPALAALHYEPHEALTPGPTGLEALTTLIAGAPPHLAPGGWLILEHGADQAEAVTHRLRATGYARIRSHRDLAGHLRVTEACWP
jgi:release factor glutamine methyltransferase